MLAAQLVLLAALATPAADASAGVVVGVAGRVTVEGGTAPRPATLGMRLEAQDVVVLERGATASIYIKGGGVVRLHDATRFELPKAAGSPMPKLKSGAIAQLESGLWVLNDPGGGLLVSPMRGDAADDTVPLSPRYEALTAPGATFVWSGGPPKARVVVAKKREVVWTSAPAAPGTLLTAGEALSLAPGEIYTWWLEPESGGAPLTAGIPFRMAAADVIESTKALDAELSAMSGDPEAKAAAAYLRLAHYVGSASWTDVLGQASLMAPGQARDRALAAARDGMRLDERDAAALAARLAAGAKP